MTNKTDGMSKFEKKCNLTDYKKLYENLLKDLADVLPDINELRDNIIELEIKADRYDCLRNMEVGESLFDLGDPHLEVVRFSTSNSQITALSVRGEELDNYVDGMLAKRKK